ncbi:hypothetical protein B0H13DRAFT_1619239, partial [Mycena leptocephala]
MASVGRPAASFITNHFTRGAKKPGRSNRYLWNCKYCGDDPGSQGANLEGRDNILPNHLCDSRTCPKAPGTARNEALRFMESKKKTSEAEEVTGSQSAGDVAVIDVDAIAGESTGPVTGSSKKRKTLQGSLDAYVDKAMTQSQQNSADRKFLRFLIHANIAFASAEDPFLAPFLHDLRPSYDAPKRYPL